jgi:hypothetical protein
MQTSTQQHPLIFSFGKYRVFLHIENPPGVVTVGLYPHGPRDTASFYYNSELEKLTSNITEAKRFARAWLESLAIDIHDELEETPTARPSLYEIAR